MERLFEHYYPKVNKTEKDETTGDSTTEASKWWLIKAPSKSKLSLMKKENLKEISDDLKLNVDGGKKTDFVTKLVEYFHPSTTNIPKGNTSTENNDSTPKENITQQKPPTINISKIRQFKKDELQSQLLKCGLSNDGNRNEMIERLDKYYRPEKYITKESKPEDPKPKDPKPEEHKTEEPKTEESKPEEPKPEEPKTEESKPEEPKPEEPKPEEPKPEEPKPEEPKTEEPKTEEEKNVGGVEETKEEPTVDAKDDEEYEITHTTVDFERLTYNGEYIYIYNCDICKFNEDENVFEKTGNKWDYKNETIYTEK